MTAVLRRTAAALAGLAVALLAVVITVTILSWGHPLAEADYPGPANLIDTAVWAAFVAVGVLIVVRRPRNAIGWLLLAAGLGLLAMAFVSSYGVYGTVVAPGALPGAGVAVVVAQTVWLLPFALIAVLLLVFPTGWFLSPPWRWAIAPSAMAVVAGVVATAELWPQRDAGRQLLLAQTVAGGEGPPAALVAGVVLILVALSAAMVALVVRWRRAGGVERLQLEWLVFAAAVNVAVGVLNGIVRYADLWLNLLSAAAYLTIPAAVAVAVLRYRLYEIDRVVSRTVAYTVVTAILVGVYASIAVLPSALLDVQSDLLVAVATLVAAAVFVPVRRRVQAVVDRRFNRARYDAQRVVERFGSRLRDTVDLDSLTGDLHGVVASTVQPARISLWLPEQRR